MRLCYSVGTLSTFGCITERRKESIVLRMSYVSLETRALRKGDSMKINQHYVTTSRVVLSLSFLVLPIMLSASMAQEAYDAAQRKQREALLRSAGQGAGHGLGDASPKSGGKTHKRRRADYEGARHKGGLFVSRNARSTVLTRSVTDPGSWCRTHGGAPFKPKCNGPLVTVGTGSQELASHKKILRRDPALFYPSAGDFWDILADRQYFTNPDFVGGISCVLFNRDAAKYASDNPTDTVISKGYVTYLGEMERSLCNRAEFDAFVKKCKEIEAKCLRREAEVVALSKKPMEEKILCITKLLFSLYVEGCYVSRASDSPLDPAKLFSDKTKVKHTIDYIPYAMMGMATPLVCRVGMALQRATGLIARDSDEATNMMKILLFKVRPILIEHYKCAQGADERGMVCATRQELCRFNLCEHLELFVKSYDNCARMGMPKMVSFCSPENTGGA